VRRSIPKRTQLRIWYRDGWTCRYCGEPVFFAPTLKILDRRSPGHGYYHPHGKGREILPLFQWRWASVDHIVPHSRGGSDDEDNFVTACWQCNLRLRDSPIESKPIPSSPPGDTSQYAWDGFASIYVQLTAGDDDWSRLIIEHINPG
jgi:hypothetical protein